MEFGKHNVVIKFTFPNIEKTFTYSYPNASMEECCEEKAMRDFYEHHAPTLFALYGYAPMNVEIFSNGEQVGAYKSCYQETMWDEWFNQGGEAWFGRFGPFTTALYCFRYREDERNKKAA